MRSSPTIFRRGLVAVATALVLITGAAVAHASDVDVAVVDVTAPINSVSLAPGASGDITITMDVTGKQDGTATFTVNRNWTLTAGTFEGSNPQTFTVDPQQGPGARTTFSTTGKVMVASGQAAGTFTLSVGAFDITNDNDKGAKLGVGDSATYSVTVETSATPSDTTAPAISYTLDPASPDGKNEWYKSNVTLTWSVTDLESAITSTTGCDTVTVSADQLATAYTCSATSAGGTSSETVTIKRDATDPTVSLKGGPADGGEYYFGQVPGSPTCQASDATSGLDGSCAVNGYGATVGPHTVTASAQDVAGNTGSDTATYTVKAWELSGFFQPVDMGDTWNIVKSGATVPLKFTVSAGATQLTDVAVVDTFTVTGISCSPSSPTDDIELTTTGGTSLRYDTTGGQFIQNWQTPKKPGACYQVTMKTDDGSTVSANFKLK